MAAPVVACDNCQRLIAEWVIESGVTLNHARKNFCRFCYAELRQAGKIFARSDDSSLMASVLEELSREKAKVLEKKLKKDPVAFVGECPSCKAHFKVNLGGLKKAEGVCPACHSFLSLAPDKVGLLGVRALMVRSISQRMGQPPALVEQMLKFFLDEMAAQMAERPFVTFGELGNFRVHGEPGAAALTAQNVDVTFRPSRKLLERIAGRQKKRVENKAPRTIPPRGA